MGKMIEQLGQQVDQQLIDTMRLIIALCIVNLFVLILILINVIRRKRVLTEQFVSNISHDLRTPLNAISGYSELMLYDETLSNRHKKSIRTIIDSSNMMLKLIGDILDHSKVREGKLVISNEVFKLMDKINEFKDLHTVTSKNKNIKFGIKVYDIDSETLMYGDSLRMMQIFNNIVSNAIKFTSKGSVVVTFRKTEGYLYFTVIDTGMGMTKKEMSKMFKRFTIVHAKTFKKFGGSGLGLSITKELVHLMKGNITVDSTPSVGTEFNIRIPLNLEEDKHGKGLSKER